MAIDPLLSQATSRVVELQRGSGDEKRRQDSAFASSRPFGSGDRDIAQAPPSKGPPPARPGSLPANDDVAAFDVAKGESRFSVNERLSPFARSGFAAQQIAQQESERDSSGVDEGAGRKSQLAADAYAFAQSRVKGAGESQGPQLVTESGVLMGFGAYDDRSRLDLRV